MTISRQTVEQEISHSTIPSSSRIRDTWKELWHPLKLLHSKSTETMRQETILPKNTSWRLCIILGLIFLFAIAIVVVLQSLQKRAASTLSRNENGQHQKDVTPYKKTEIDDRTPTTGTGFLDTEQLDDIFADAHEYFDALRLDQLKIQEPLRTNRFARENSSRRTSSGEGRRGRSATSRHTFGH